MDEYTKESIGKVVLGLIEAISLLILMIITLNMPFYVFLSFGIWLIGGTISVFLIKSNSISVKLSVVLPLSFVFYIIILCTLDKCEISLEASKDFFVLLAIIVMGIHIMYWCGNNFQEKFLENKDKKRNEQIETCKMFLSQLLDNKNTVIKVIDSYNNKTKNIFHFICLVDEISPATNPKIKSNFIGTENQRFISCRESLLSKIATSERNNFPKKYEDIEPYYNSLKQEIKNLKSQIKNIQSLNIKELKELQKRS